MTDPMTTERFAALAEAYGTLERWPEEFRAAGQHMAGSPAYAAILIEAEALDRRLDEWVVPAPGPGLRRLVVASHRRRWMVRARLWWSAIGVGAALAGAVAGSAAAFTLEIVHPPAAFEATAFGDIGPGERTE